MNNWDWVTKCGRCGTPLSAAAVEDRKTIFLPETETLRPLVRKLGEYGYRKGHDPNEHDASFKALERLVEVGEPTVPLLLEHLGESKLIALALGKIATLTAIDALGRELNSQDWRRVEAAARGLGYSRSPKAKPYIERALGSSFDQSIADVHEALRWAMNELYTVHQDRGGLTVDKNNLWQQINSIGSWRDLSPEDREQRIAWWKAVVQELPNLEVNVPGYDYTPNDAKARAWSLLASIIYRLRMGEGMFHGVKNKPCQEAKFCFEQALKLEPNDAHWAECVRNVS